MNFSFRGMRPRQTQVQKIIAFSRSKPLGAVSAVIIILTILAAAVSYVVPGVLPHDPLDVRAHEEKYLPPQPGAWLGSDHLGRDELSRIIAGSQISIYVGLLSVGIGVTLGALIGILSAYIGGVVDLAIQRIVDAMMAFPPIILALGLVAVLGGSANNVIMALLVILLPGTIRVIRSQVLSIKELDYTLAATAIGAGSIRIMLKHILPNVVASYIVLGTITLGFAIIIEASLSFLGVGVPPDIPDLGRHAHPGHRGDPHRLVAGGVPRHRNFGGGLRHQLPGRRPARRVGPDGCGDVRSAASSR